MDCQNLVSKTNHLAQKQVLGAFFGSEKGGADPYRFGFNGQMKVNEVAGVGNFMDYKARGQDIRIARFISIDPLTKRFPMLSPYQFASNTPIQAIDIDGLEAMKVTTRIWANSGVPQINQLKEFDLNSPRYGNKGVLYDYSNSITGESYYYYHVYPEVTIRPPVPTPFEKWWGLQKKAWENDYQGSAGYDAVGKHIVPTFINTFSLLIGVGELNLAVKAGSAVRASIATAELGLTVDALLGGGNDETPLESSLPQNGKDWLNSLKIGIGLKGMKQGYTDIKHSFKSKEEAGELGKNIFNIGKSTIDVKEGGKKVIKQSGKLGTGSSDIEAD